MVGILRHGKKLQDTLKAYARTDWGQLWDLIWYD